MVRCNTERAEMETIVVGGTGVAMNVSATGLTTPAIVTDAK